MEDEGVICNHNHVGQKITGERHCLDCGMVFPQIKVARIETYGPYDVSPALVKRLDDIERKLDKVIEFMSRTPRRLDGCDVWE